MRLSNDMLRWLDPNCPEEVIRILESPGLHHVAVKDGQYWIDGNSLNRT